MIIELMIHHLRNQNLLVLIGTRNPPPRTQENHQALAALHLLPTPPQIVKISQTQYLVVKIETHHNPIAKIEHHLIKIGHPHHLIKIGLPLRLIKIDLVLHQIKIGKTHQEIGLLKIDLLSRQVSHLGIAHEDVINTNSNKIRLNHGE